MVLQAATKRFLRVSIGFACLALGMAGLVLPILQGWLFLGLGVVLLSKDIPFFRRISEYVRHRFPVVDRAMQRADQMAERFKTRLRSFKPSRTPKSCQVSKSDSIK